MPITITGGARTTGGLSTLDSPSLSLDFMNGSLDSRITFSRGSQATVTDNTGKLTYAPNNLLTNSENFEVTAWNKGAGSVSVTSNTTVAPDNTTTADTITEGTNNGIHNIYQAVTVANNTSYTWSGYVKANGRSIVQLICQATGVIYTAEFNLTGVTTTNRSGSGTATITSVGNGWYRISATALSTAAGTGYWQLNLCSAANTTSYAGDGVSGVFLWGAQLEQVTYQTTASTYNSTTVKNLIGFTQEFDNAAWTKSGSFIQTNLLTYSEQFDNAAWNKTGSSITVAGTTAPNPSATANALIEDTATSAHDCYQNITLSAVSYTYSAYVKANGRTWIRMFVFQSGGTANSVWFNLSTGTVGTISAGASNASITNVGNDWYRCSYTFTALAAAASAYIQLADADQGSSYTGNGTSGIYLWGAQLVQGSVAGDYQVTTASASAVQYTAPDGTISADKVAETGTNAQHYMNSSSFATIIGTPYTLSVYVKAGEISTCYFAVTTATFGSTNATFNLVNGTVTSSTNCVAAIQDQGNGWYRCSIIATATATSTAAFFIAPTSLSTYTGTEGNGIYVWGAQVSNSGSVVTYAYNPGAAPASSAYYGPRFDYDPISLQPKGLLVESQGTNLLTYSQDFTNAAWTATAYTITPNAIIAPDGTMTGTQITATATGGTTIRTISSATATTLTYSIYAKLGTVAANLTNFLIRNATTATNLISISLADTTNSNAFGTASVTPVGNGWFRVIITATSGITVGDSLSLYFGATSVRDEGLYWYVWGGQLEASAFATSYIPTVASTVTRSADVSIMTGANFSNWYNRYTGTCVVEFTPDKTVIDNTARILTISQVSAASRVIDIHVNSGSWMTYNGATNLVGGSATVTSIPQRFSAAYAISSYAACLNAGTVATASTATVNAPTQMTIGYFPSGAGTQFMNGYIRSILYYPARFVDATVQWITRR